METSPARRRSDIAPDTLVVASVGSAAATVVIGRFGLAGTLLGAALFPVVLALAKELAKRPTRTVPEAVRRRARGPRRPGPAERPEAPGGRSFRERLAGVRWRPVLVTAAAAFAVVVAAFTLAELAFGGSLVADRPTTFFSPGAGEPAPPADDPGAPPPADAPPEEEPPPDAPAEPPAEEPPPPPAEEPPAEEPPPAEGP